MPDPTLTSSTVQSLADLAAFQPGRIASRVLLKNAGGSATLFAFAAGEGLREHTAPFDARLIVLDGLAEVTLGGETHAVGVGETVLLPAHAPHAVHAPDDMRMLLVLLRA